MIRKLTVDDYARYYPLINEFRPTVFTEEEFRTYVSSLPSTMEIWVIEENEAIIATATVIFEPKLIFDMCTFAHIEDVCVSATHRKSGVGSLLMKTVINICTAKGCRKVTLVCNESVAPFYIRNGFEKRGIQCSMLLNEECSLFHLRSESIQSIITELANTSSGN
jgi:GNAT superfamily N-acetyltransferase